MFQQFQDDVKRDARAPDTSIASADAGSLGDAVGGGRHGSGLSGSDFLRDRRAGFVAGGSGFWAGGGWLWSVAVLTFFLFLGVSGWCRMVCIGVVWSGTLI